MQPLLYFSYGMTKTGSTLAFQIVRSALDLCGFPQDQLSASAIKQASTINFVNHISDAQMDEIKAEMLARGYSVVLKTHTRPDPVVKRMIKSGEALAFVAYRDPRDIALSMLDHGRRARAEGKQAFAEFGTMDDVLKNLRHQFNSMAEWLRLPGIIPLYYEDIAFDTVSVAGLILQKLGLKLDPEILTDIVHEDRFTQKNKGVSQRHLTEMPADISEAIEQEFQPFIQKFIKDRHKLAAGPRILLPKPEILRHEALG